MTLQRKPLILQAMVTGRKTRAAPQGPNLTPIKELLEAKRIHTGYQDEAANKESARHLSRAIGSGKTLPLIRENLDKALDGESQLSDMVVHLALVETRKK